MITIASISFAVDNTFVCLHVLNVKNKWKNEFTRIGIENPSNKIYNWVEGWRKVTKILTNGHLRMPFLRNLKSLSGQVAELRIFP
mgnify:CR=1 FL=1